MRFGFGVVVLDRINGFVGVVTARAEYMTGCTQLLVESRELHSGKAVTRWIDEVRLEMEPAALPVVLPVEVGETPSGPVGVEPPG